MASDNIEKLYKHFAVLADAKDKIGEHKEEYLEILKAVKGSDREKRLASQFLTRFFKDFPSLAEKAIDALLDLCEDEDTSIRKQAIKDLPTLCKEKKIYTQKIADILTQLLQSEDTSELAVVNNSLLTLMKIDAKATLTGLFTQILTGEDLVREKAMKFLSENIKGLDENILVKDAEDYLIKETKRVLLDVTGDEFNTLMDLLHSTKLGKTISGQQQLVDIVADQIEIEQPFNPNPGEESELLDRLINCTRMALNYFSSQIRSTRFVAYICEQIFPKLDSILAKIDDTGIELELFKTFAELCMHCGALDDPTKNIAKVYDQLIAYMPQPPTDPSAEEPRLDFSHVECLMFSFHKLARQAPTFLTDDAERFKKFKMRLQYFARGIKGYIKKLREALSGKTPEELKSDDNKIKVIALKTTSNIDIMTKDLFHSPPSYKSIVNPSWKPFSRSGVKRPAATTDESSASNQKRSNEKELYTPPNGKFSNKAGSYDRGSWKRNRFRNARGAGGGRGKFNTGKKRWRSNPY